MLKTVQITVPEQLLVKIDKAVADLKTSRSSFARQAFERTLFDLRLAQMERQDAEAYAHQTEAVDETAAWESVQDWGDA